MEQDQSSNPGTKAGTDKGEPRNPWQPHSSVSVPVSVSTTVRNPGALLPLAACIRRHMEASPLYDIRQVIDSHRKPPTLSTLSQGHTTPVGRPLPHSTVNLNIIGLAITHLPHLETRRT